MEHLLANLAQTTRTETLNDREFLVASATLIVPGVLSGNRGPILYTHEEIGRDPSIWNGVPVVAGHPYKDDQPVSARDPEILNESGLGFVFAAEANGTLKAEVWFDVLSVERVNPDLLTNIRNREKVELSTGLMATAEEVEPATYNNKAYKLVAKNLRADHLAILTGEVGACSVKEGCGVNNKVEKHVDPELANNALTHGETRKQLSGQIKARFETKDTYVYVKDITDDSVIFEDGGQLLRLPYSTDKEIVTLSGDFPEKVRRQVEFVAANAESGSTISPQKNKAEMMKKNELIDEIISNGCGCHEESDRTTLEKYSQERLQKIVDNAKQQAEAEELLEVARKGFTDPGGQSHIFNKETKTWDSKQKEKQEKEESIMNSQGVGLGDEPQTMEQYLASAPPEVVELLNHAKQMKSDEKSTLIEKIVNTYPEEQRETLRDTYGKLMIEDLKVVVNSLPEDESSQTGLYGSTGGVTNRRRTPDEELEVLTVPRMQFN